MNLYDSSENLISTSNAQYVEDGTPPYNGSYTFTNLESGQEYEIEVIGQTVNKANVNTGLVRFSVVYKKPDVFSALTLTNNCEEGQIIVNSNIIAVIGVSNPTPPIYIDNKEVDLTNPDSWVEWNEGFQLTGNFIARLWFRKPNPYSDIVKMSNITGETITVKYMQGYENRDSIDMQSYIELYVNSVENMPYYIYSNFIDILDDTEYYCLWITKINNIYKLQLGKV